MDRLRVLHAQSTFGSIVGVVHDATQAVVPGATVNLRSLDDNSTGQLALRIDF